MNYRPLLLCCLLASFLLPVAAQRIAVLSDLHLLAPELIQPGAAIDRVDNTDMKMVRQSDDLATSITDTLLAVHPNLVLISGDLTYNGERASHLRLLQHLQRLHEAGIAVCVVPGNHDLLNPHARSFFGDQAMEADYLSPKDFPSLYDPLVTVPSVTVPEGSSPLLRDSLSLSYAASPLPSLVILGIDSNRYGDNLLRRRGDERDEYHTDGYLRPETLRWLCDRATEATKAGKLVIAVMHHHLVEHFDGESVLLPQYITPDSETTAAALATAGVRVVFTGHLHITDAVTSPSASSTDPSVTITDISTGSASTYPFPLRFGTIDKEGKLTIETCFLHPSDKLVADGRSQIEKGVNAIALMVARRAWDRFGKQLTNVAGMLALLGSETRLPSNSQELAQLMTREMYSAILHCLIAVTSGNEPEYAPNLETELREAAVRALTSVLPSVAADTAQEIIENLWPRVQPLIVSVLKDINRADTNDESRTDDHQLVISLKP
ncbi:MAG: metallophosphoesterase [Bacteroidaceae bacterium]|nr:metallophosphoesterase [Bacteroidaceae bacterium]